MKKALFSQAATYGVMSALNLALPAVLAPILTHYLTPADYGVISLFDILLQCVGPLVGLGTQSAIRRRYFDHDRPTLSSYAMSSVRVVTFMHLVLLVILLAIVPFIEIEGLVQTRWLLLLVPWLYAHYWVTLSVSFFQLEHRPLAFGAMQGGMTATDLLSSLFLVIVVGLGWQGRVGGQVLAVSLFGVLSMYFVSRRVAFDAPASREHARDAVAYGAPAVPYAILERLIALTDRALLIAFVSLAATGTYALAVQVASLIMLATTGFSLAWQPWLFARMKENTHAARWDVVRAFVIAAALLAVAAIALVLLSPVVLPLIIGEKFLPALPLIPWLAAGFYCRAISRIMSDIVMFEGRTMVLTKVTIVSVIVNATTNLLLVPSYGAKGAAIATSLAFAFTALVVAFVSRAAWRRLALRVPAAGTEGAQA